MATEPHLPASDDADPNDQSSPAGLIAELEDEAEEEGATTGPQPDDT
jgi:hypothetical protein